MPYIIGYAKLGTSKCKGPKPCSGSSIPKGSLRFGTQVMINGNTSFAWRHYGCMTAKQFQNIKNDFDEVDDVDGFEDLTPEDQEKFRKAFAEGHVADEDIPDTARVAPEVDEDGNPVESPKKGRGKGAPKGKKAKDAEEDDSAEEKKSKKKAPAKKKASKAKKEESEVESEEAVESEEEEKEQSKKKQAPAKKRSAKKQPESEEEEEEEEEEKQSKKTKKAPAKKAPAKKRTAKKEQASDESEPEEEQEKPKAKGGRKPAAKKQKVEASEEESA